MFNIKLLVTGGRDYHDEYIVNTVLRVFHRRVPIECLIHGDAIGADYLCGHWASQNDVPVKVYGVTKLDYERFGRRAPLIRNCKMLDNENPDLLLAFPGKNGTAHMVEYALKMGVPVYDVGTEKVLKPFKWRWDFRNYLTHIKNNSKDKGQGPEPV